MVTAAISGFVESALSAVLDDFVTRQLSHQETKRVAIASYRILDKIGRRLIAGDQIRDDDFFNGNLRDDGRSPAEELFEGLLIKCKNEHENKKNKHIENIFAEVAFHTEVSYVVTNSILNLAGRLSYRQYCLASVLGQYQKFSVKPNDLNFRIQIDEHNKDPILFLKQDFAELYQNGFFEGDIIEGKDYLGSIGKLFFELTELDEMDFDDLKDTRLMMSRS